MYKQHDSHSCGREHRRQWCLRQRSGGQGDDSVTYDVTKNLLRLVACCQPLLRRCCLRLPLSCYEHPPACRFGACTRNLLSERKRHDLGGSNLLDVVTHVFDAVVEAVNEHDGMGQLGVRHHLVQRAIAVTDQVRELDAPSLEQAQDDVQAECLHRLTGALRLHREELRGGQVPVAREVHCGHEKTSFEAVHVRSSVRGVGAAAKRETRAEEVHDVML